MLKVRIISPNGSRRHTADIKSRKWGKFAITMRRAPNCKRPSLRAAAIRLNSSLLN